MLKKYNSQEQEIAEMINGYTILIEMNAQQAMWKQEVGHRD